MKGVKEIHNFRWSFHASVKGRHYPKLKVRQLCYTGNYKEEKMVIAPLEEQADLHPPSYVEQRKCPGIGQKLGHLLEMYDCCIPPDHHLEVLPPLL